MAALVIVETIGLAVLALLVAGCCGATGGVAPLHHLVSRLRSDAPVLWLRTRTGAGAATAGFRAHDVAASHRRRRSRLGVSHPDANVLSLSFERVRHVRALLGGVAAGRTSRSARELLR